MKLLFQNKNYLKLGLVLMGLSALPSCQFGRFIFYNFADVNDHKKFPARDLSATTPPFVFPISTQPKSPKFINETGIDTFMSKHNTLAFLIIKNDSIQFEKYYNGAHEDQIVPSFSMAKSVVSILVGCAIDDGLIASVKDPVTKYIPEMAENGFDKVSLLHLLQMTSGIDYKESYVNPFGDAAAFYYGRNLEKQTLKLRLKREPGMAFEYSSGNPQILGLILKRVLKNKTITQYAQEKLWTPLEMEYPASWSLDKKRDGLEKTFCCLNARARDFAKIGRLYLNKGRWNGRQIVSEKWVEESLKPDTSDGSVNYYQYQWWLPRAGTDFMAQGILGQYIYVVPEKNLVIVRLGKNTGKTSWVSVFKSIADAY